MAIPALAVKIFANVADAQKQIATFQDQIVTTSAAMQRMSGALQGDALIRQAHNLTAAVQNIGGATKLTEAEKARLNATLTKAIEKYQALGKEAPAAMRELERATRAADPPTKTLLERVVEFGPRLQQAGAAMQSVGRTMTAAITAPLVGIATLAAKSAIDFESSFAGVRKTVKATEGEFAALSRGFREMAKQIPINVNELNRIGEAAGQLGIQTNAILGFTRTMADLGVTTNLSADQAATAFARFANITQMPQSQFDQLGSTVVELGNRLATTEAEIAEFGLRIAGAGEIAGLTEAQILAIGGAMSSVGVEAEAGGTSVQKVLLGMTEAVAKSNDSLQVFARTAGVSAAEFAKAFREDAGQAFTLFVEGLGRAGTDAFGILEKLDLQDQRLIRSFLSLAGAGDLLRNSIDIGTHAWQENVALTKEAEQRYKTAAAQLQVFWNQLRDVAITLGNALLPAIRSAVNAFDDFIPYLERAVKWFTALPVPAQLAGLAVAGLFAAIGPSLWMLGSMATGLSSLIGLLGITGFASSATAAGAAAGTAATGVTGLATAFGLLKVAIPGAALLGGAAAGIWALIEAKKEFDRIEREGTIRTVARPDMRFGTAVPDNGQMLVRRPDLFRTPRAPNVDIDSLIAAMGNIGPAAKSAGQHIRQLTEEEEKRAKAQKEATEEMRRALIPLTAEQTKNVEAWSKQGFAVELMAKRLDVSNVVIKRHLDLQKDMEAVSRMTGNALNLLTDNLSNFAKSAEGQFIDLMADVRKMEGRAVFNPLAVLTGGGLDKTLSAPILGQFKQFFQKDLGNVILGAVQGGGNVLGSVGASIMGKIFEGGTALNAAGATVRTFGQGIADKLSGFVSGGLGKILPSGISSAIGGALGSIIPGLGTMVGSLVGPLVGKLGGAIGKIFGFGGEEKQINPLRQKFIDAAGGLHELNVKAQAAGLTLTNLLRADTVKEYEAAIAELNGAFERHGAAVQTAFNHVITAAQNAGGAFPDALKPAINELLTLQGLTNDQRDALLKLVADVKPNFEQLEGTAKKYGIELAGLGPAFQSAHVDRIAQAIFKDFQALTRAGGDVGGVLSGMGDEISNLVNDAKNFGVAIPENMKPLIDELLLAGKLTDEDGEKLKDLTGIKFKDTPLDEGTNAIVKAIQDLGNILKGLPAIAKDAASGIGQHLSNVSIAPIHVGIEFDVPDLPSFDMGHAGGLVTAHGIQQLHQGGMVHMAKVLPFVRRYHSGLAADEVPAILQTGESVLNRRATSALGPGAIGALNRGAGGGLVVSGRFGGSQSNVHDDEVHQELAALRRELTQIRRMEPHRMAAAALDAANLGGRRRR